MYHMCVFAQSQLTIGKAVRIARTEEGYSQEKLAELIGVSRQTIISIEHELTNPGFILVYMLTRLLKLPLMDLLPNVPPNTCVCHLFGPAECRVCYPKGYKQS